MLNKNRIMVVLVTLVMFTGSVFLPATLGFNSDGQRVDERPISPLLNPVSVNVEVNGEITKLTYTIKGFSTREITINGEKYTEVYLPGEPMIMKRGNPDLPKICRSIIIPDDTKMGVRVVDLSYKDYYNVLIPPSKGNLLRTVDPNTVPYRFSKVYITDEWYPGKLVELSEPYILRDFRGQVVKFYPFQYNPVKKILRFYDHLSVEVLPVAPGEVNVFERNKSLTEFEEDFAQIYERHFINFNKLDYRDINFAFPEYSGNQFYTPVSDKGNLLIICYDDFYDEMKPFVTWKNMKGVPTEIVNLSEVGSTADDIYDYIVNYYNTKGLTFVLLVGDAAQMPTMMVDGHASDPSYSYIVGNDHYPDLFVGRFSAENTDHVDTQVERSVNYEKYPDSDGDWYHKGTGIASNQGTGDDGEYDWEHMRNIRDDLLGYTYTEVDELYDGSHGGADADGDPSSGDVSTVLNEGRSIVNYCGHGSTTSWGTTGFSNSDVNALTNDNMLPFIFSVACLNGNFVSSTCFAEAWLRATDDSNGEPTGAIATFMSSKSQAWSPPMDAQDEFVDILVESYEDNKKTTFGGLVFNGCMHMNDEYGSDGYAETDAWHVFGDPSIQVRTDTPDTMTVIHDDTMESSATTFEVTVVGVEGALCALSRDGVLLGYDYTDSSGHATIELDEPIGESCTIDLVVTAYNKIPYIATIQVISVDFSWTPPYPNTGSPIQFHDETQGTVLSWHWDFGDGETSDQQNPTHTYYSEGTYDVTLTVTKNDGTYSVTKPVEVKDNWEPIAVAHPEFYAGNNPTIDFDGSDSWDPDGSIVSYHWDFKDGNTSTEVSPTHTYTQDGIYNVTLTVTDNKGAESVAQCEIRVDAYTPPVTTAEISGALGNDGWYRGTSVKIRFVATDWSGVDDTEYRVDGGNWRRYTDPFRVWGSGYHTVEFFSVDIYGNVENTKTVEIKIDNTPPLLNVNFSGEQNNGWYTTPVTVTCNANDELSGLLHILYSLDESRWEEYNTSFTIEDDGIHTLRVYAEDVAGNTMGKTTPHTVQIDTGPPETTCSMQGIGADGNYYRNVTITLTAVDNGIGVNKTFYRLDGGTWEVYTQPLLVEERGEHTLEYYSVDYLGHQETTQTETFRVSNINFNLKITNPENGLYLFGKQLLFIKKTIIIGGVTVKAELVPFDPGIPPEFEQVVFYVDNGSVATFTAPPFEWSWEGSAFGRHTLTVSAFNKGDSVTESMEVLIFKLM